MRGAEYVATTRLEDSAYRLEMQLRVLGVEVLEQLITEHDIGKVGFQFEIVAVVDDELEVFWHGLKLTRLVGDVYPVDGADALTYLDRKSVV